MYQALYRAWRPAVFSDVVGQPHITDTLRAQIESGRLSHAYLFTGSRGTGKTTCAKILARAVNCESPQRGDPCNRCPSCRAIAEGSVLDVAEIDAASNSGVDNIRSLRDEIVYSPAAVKMRVYIIDEVHMLSTGAFNALLKTLEEPPPHALFILATTEAHKVPATIVSRCQRFAFRRIDTADISARLSLVARSEKIPLTAAAAELLARMSDGSMRDGLSLLDQCAGAADGREIGEDIVSDALGLAGVYKIARWAESLAKGDAVGALTALEGFYSGGREYSSLLDELSNFLRDLLMARMLGDHSGTKLDRQTALPLAQLYPNAKLLSALELISQTQGRLLRGGNKRVETELCVLRLCGVTEAAAAPAQPPRQTLPEPAPQPSFTTPGPAKEEKTAVPEPEQPVDAVMEAAPPERAKTAPGGWEKLLEKSDPIFRDALTGAVPTVNGDSVSISVGTAYAQGLLSGAGFAAKAKEFFPGGVSVTMSKSPPGKGAKDRLERLVRDGGDIIISE